MDFKDFKSLVNDYLQDNTSENRKRLLEVLQTKNWHDLIHNIMDDTILDELVCNTYVHDNGFIKLILIDKRPDYAVRLHIWPPNVMKDSSIHNHPWDLDGLIVTGKYTWSIYHENENSSSKLNLYECKYKSDYKTHEFIRIRDIYMDEVLCFDMKKDCLYAANKNIYHRITKSNEDWAATLMICGQVESNTAHVILEAQKDTNTSIAPSSLSSEKIKGYLARILKELEI